MHIKRSLREIRQENDRLGILSPDEEEESTLQKLLNWFPTLRSESAVVEGLLKKQKEKDSLRKSLAIQEISDEIADKKYEDSFDEDYNQGLLGSEEGIETLGQAEGRWASQADFEDEEEGSLWGKVKGLFEPDEISGPGKGWKGKRAALADTGMLGGEENESTGYAELIRKWDEEKQEEEQDAIANLGMESGGEEDEGFFAGLFSSDSSGKKSKGLSSNQKIAGGLIRDMFAEKEQAPMQVISPARVTPGKQFDMSSLLASRRPKKERYRNKGLLARA